MKKLIQRRTPVFVLAAISLLLVSCTKDEILSQKTVVPQSEANNRPILAPKFNGSLMLLVLPREVRPIITIKNETFSSQNFYYCKDGYARIDNVPPGIYSIFLQPADSEFREMEIRDIKISDRYITNLGVIKLR